LPLKNLEIDIIPNTDDICLSLYIINTLWLDPTIGSANQFRLLTIFAPATPPPPPPTFR
jgi:hypothetical protein